MPIMADLSRAVVSAAVASPPNATETLADATLASSDAPALDPLCAELTATGSMHRLAVLFAALADTTRLRIIEALAHSELCVGTLSTTLDLTQSATSHQLRILRDLRLVKSRRAGRLVYYSLDDDAIYPLLKQGLEYVREQGTV